MDPLALDKNRLALGIRQPWAELILQGVKTIEVRKTHVTLRGPIYVYASRKLADQPFAHEAAVRHDIDVAQLPTGIVLGSVEIVDSIELSARHSQAACVPGNHLSGRVGWVLENPQRFDEPVPARFIPYGIWFYPWKRREVRSDDEREQRRQRRRRKGP